MTQRYAIHHMFRTYPEDIDKAEYLLNIMLSAHAKSAGFRVIPGTVTYSFNGRARVNGEPFMTEEELAAGMTGEEVLGRAEGEVEPRAESTPI